VKLETTVSAPLFGDTPATALPRLQVSIWQAGKKEGTADHAMATV